MIIDSKAKKIKNQLIGALVLSKLESVFKNNPSFRLVKVVSDTFHTRYLKT